jgi:hypothetical protein
MSTGTPQSAALDEINHLPSAQSVPTIQRTTKTIPAKRFFTENKIVNCESTTL